MNKKEFIAKLKKKWNSGEEYFGAKFPLKYCRSESGAASPTESCYVIYRPNGRLAFSMFLEDDCCNQIWAQHDRWGHISTQSSFDDFDEKSFDFVYKILEKYWDCGENTKNAS